MVVGDNASVDLGNISVDSNVAASSSSNDQDHHNHNNNALIQPLYIKAPQVGHHQAHHHDHHHQQRSDGGESYKREIRELQELFSKLNPMAAEFVPPSHSNNNNFGRVSGLNGFNGVNGDFMATTISAAVAAPPPPPPTATTSTWLSMEMASTEVDKLMEMLLEGRKNYGQVKRRISSRTSMAQQEEIVRRTVYVSDIDQQVTEEQLAALFINCGQVVDCRICGDPKSVLRFAFIEFTDEEGAQAALSLSGTMLGYYPVKVLPSKTAIAPNDDEREMCARTIYCTNIDRNLTQANIKLFFESLCGEVYRLRLLGDHHHPTRIAFVEFVMAESAIAALNCSGVVLGSLPIRVSPSKTPVRPRGPRITML